MEKNKVYAYTKVLFGVNRPSRAIRLWERNKSIKIAIAILVHLKEFSSVIGRKVLL